MGTKIFEIFDVNKPLMVSNELIEANTPIEAARKYMQSVSAYKGRNIKRSSSNYVELSATEIILINGEKFRSSKPTQWYKIM